jgi:hypothetical protein
MSFGWSDFFLRLGLIVLVTAIGTALLIWQKGRLTALFTTRARRVLFEGGILLALSATTAILFASIDVPKLLQGTVTAETNARIWWLTVVATLQLLAQVLIVLHADSAQLERAELISGHQAEKEQLASDLDRARRQRETFYVIGEQFLKVVTKKHSRLRSASSRSEMIDALSPGTQAQALLLAGWTIVHDMLQHANGHQGSGGVRLRIAHYSPDAQKTALCCSFSWNGQHDNCVIPPISGRRAFGMKLGEAQPGSLAVAVASLGREYWVADTHVANADPSHPFKFFDQDEPEVLKSIVGVPVTFEGNNARPHDVIVIDTNVAGFFDDADAERKTVLKLLFKQLVHRMLLELEVKRCLQQEGER